MNGQKDIKSRELHLKFFVALGETRTVLMRIALCRSLITA
jgi:hypothetical protein